jgi:hypothetical protein
VVVAGSHASTDVGEGAGRHRSDGEVNEGLYSLGFRGRGRRVIRMTDPTRLCCES